MQKQYESPELELLTFTTLRVLAQSDFTPDGEGDDFEWGTFAD